MVRPINKQASTEEKESHRDYSKEVKELIKSLPTGKIIHGKPKNFFLGRCKITEERLEKDFRDFEYLVFTEKQRRNNEDRYLMYFQYSRLKGIAYTITFREEKIRLVTLFPLGRRTLVKYNKKFS